MAHKIVVPSVGESVTEVSVLKWHKNDGEKVNTGDVLLELESDKATVEIVAESNGVLKITKQQGETVPIGEVLGEIDESAQPTVQSTPVPSKASVDSKTPPSSAPPSRPSQNKDTTAGPAARKMAEEKNIDLAQVSGSGKEGRVTKEDIQKHLEQPQQKSAPTPVSVSSSPAQAALTSASSVASSSASSSSLAAGVGERREKMSLLRRKIAERLKGAQNTAAILTTFNEIDMGDLMELRNKNKDAYKQKHNLPMSFMSFFTVACSQALKELPTVNAFIEGDEIIYHEHHQIGIAVGTDRGLVVPVIRNVEQKSFIQIDQEVVNYANKARDGKISINDMTGGTFTISNGGTYGSMLSTPILNPPQSAILGMHATKERPVVRNGKIEIRPIMYVALSYDHRIIDGKEAVTFLVYVKDFIEHPEKLRLEF